MDNIIDYQPPAEKIFKEKAFWVGTFLGGPLVAGYLFSTNFKSFGQPEKVKPTWIITIAATIVIFGGAMMIPESVNIPNQLFPITYSAIAYAFFKRYQEDQAIQHIESGGLVYSWWRIIGVALIGALISLLVFAGVIFATGGFEGILY